MQLALIINTDMNTFSSKIEPFRASVATLAGVQSGRVSMYNFDVYDSSKATPLTPGGGIPVVATSILAADTQPNGSSAAARGLLASSGKQQQQPHRSAVSPLTWLQDRVAMLRLPRRSLLANAQLQVTTRISTADFNDANIVLNNIRNSSRQDAFAQEAQQSGFPVDGASLRSPNLTLLSSSSAGDSNNGIVDVATKAFENPQTRNIAIIVGGSVAGLLLLFLGVWCINKRRNVLNTKPTPPERRHSRAGDSAGRQPRPSRSKSRVDRERSEGGARQQPRAPKPAATSAAAASSGAAGLQYPPIAAAGGGYYDGNRGRYDADAAAATGGYADRGAAGSRSARHESQQAGYDRYSGTYGWVEGQGTTAWREQQQRDHQHYQQQRQQRQEYEQPYGYENAYDNEHYQNHAYAGTGGGRRQDAQVPYAGSSSSRRLDPQQAAYGYAEGGRNSPREQQTGGYGGADGYYAQRAAAGATASPSFAYRSNQGNGNSTAQAEHAYQGNPGRGQGGGSSAAYQGNYYSGSQQYGRR